MLRAALEETGRTWGPGLFGLVAERGVVVFDGAVGTADLRTGRPIEGIDRFRIGSITKTYTAALVLQLIGEGLLSPADALGDLLPGLIPEPAGITVDLLLRMRSGLPDYFGPVYGDDPLDLTVLDRYWSPEQLVAAALTAPGRVPPDTVHRYSSTDYVLLGLLVERATGERVDAQLWRRVIDPLGLTGTTFPTVDPYLRGPHPVGYIRAAPDRPWRDCTTLTPSESFTAGAIVSTPADVARFFDALLDGRVLDRSGLDRMTDCREPIDAHRHRGPGLVRFEVGGVVAYGQQGGMPGFTSVVMRTADGRCVVLYQNGIDMSDPLPYRTPFMLTALGCR